MQGVPLSATATGDATISFQFDTLLISKAANPDSHTPEGIMRRQPRLILRNATGFTESADSWIVAQPEGISDPICKQFLVQRRLQKGNHASFRLPR